MPDENEGMPQSLQEDGHELSTEMRLSMKQHKKSISNMVVKKQYKDDIFVEMIQRELKTVGPTYEQLIEITGYLQTIKFTDPYSSLGNNILV